MIYPNIDVQKTKEKAEKTLNLVKELYKIQVFSLKKEIPIFELNHHNLSHNVLIKIETPYEDLIKSIYEGINYLPLNDKYILYTYIKGVSIYHISLGLNCELAMTNAYKLYPKALFGLALLVPNLIVYKEMEEKT